MDIRNAEIPNKVENPLLRAPYSPLYVPEPFEPGASKANLLRRLKTCLAQMDTLCFDKDATLRSGEILWPSQAWLDELSEVIWRLSSLNRRGGKDLWTCAKAIDNRYSTLKLSGKIEKLVERAANLYHEPFALAIQRQAIAGNQAAYDCFAALKTCHDGKSQIAFEDWEQYHVTLQPGSAESCQIRAAQIIIDWQRDDLSPQKPWDPLAFWLSIIGNPSLAVRLMRPGSAAFYAIISKHENKTRPKELAAMRQRKYLRQKNDPIRRSLMRVLGTPTRRTRTVKAKK